MKQASMERWTAEKSAELYGIRDWGDGLFEASSDGNLLVRLDSNGQECKISLTDIVSDLEERGMAMPVLLRFGDLLDLRIKQINESFRQAIADLGYQGDYRGVYPIKVNQQQQVIEEIAKFGRHYHHGFEAGSKPELIAALAYMHDPEAYVICNGYKDEEFIDLALYGQKIGIRTILVIEMPGELDLILERAAKMQVRPIIGVRVRLSARASGHWTESGGDRSVFGLNTSQIITITDELRNRDMLDCLQLMHYHLGSQLPNIREIRTGITEASRFYAELVREGAPMGLFDIGGGLAVDYDGSHTNFGSSRNYSTSEYCTDIIEVIMGVCDESEVPHPTIISESGRATVAYYSVLLFNILDVTCFDSQELPDKLPDDAHELLRNMLEIKDVLTTKNVQECYHDVLYYRDEVRSRFLHGTVSLRERATCEQFFWALLTQIHHLIRKRKYIPDEMQGLGSALVDIYYGNFSVFQSLPDAWAIEQLFPIMPIHRLNEAPTRKGIIADITCDCDGKIDRFIDLHDVRHSLPMHPLRDNEEYIMGAFLVGAYQETLGDLHNLMGDTNVVSVRVDESGKIEYTREINGDTVADVLSYVEYEPKDMVDRVRCLAEQAVREGRISARERRKIMEAYQAGMRGYTYYEK
jgi:arginine decarboxylase